MAIDEVRRKFLRHTRPQYLYFFCAVCQYRQVQVPGSRKSAIDQRPEIDQWIISLLNTFDKDVDAFYADFEPTKAARAIQDFVDAHLSNWYVPSLSRRRFWKSEDSDDKLSAYQTLYTCLVSIAKLMSPIAPFFADRLYTDLNKVTPQRSFLNPFTLATIFEYHTRPGKRRAGRTHAKWRRTYRRSYCRLRKNGRHQRPPAIEQDIIADT